MKSNFSYIQRAWLKVLYDFRAWMIPDTEFLKSWKERPIVAIDKTEENSILGFPIVTCRTNMMDDTATMLKAYRESDGDKDKISSILPVILTAVGAINNPPNDSGRLLNIPYFCKTVRNGEVCEYRFVPKMVRCQLAFISPSSADANSLADQFCTYMMDDKKRRFNIDFVVREGNETKGIKPIIETVRSSVFDNDSLSPNDVPLSEKNLSVFVVDTEITFPLPQFRFDERNNIDHGSGATGMPNYSDGLTYHFIKEVNANYYVINPKTGTKDLDNQNSAKYHDETDTTTIKQGLNDD